MRVKLSNLTSNMKREYYSDSITTFLKTKPDEILGKLARNSDFDLGQNQRDSWLEEISILQNILSGREGSIYFEYSIPRMGRRIDVVLIIKNAIFILEFKVGEKEFIHSAIDQAWDYALDLKNFHETSHKHLIAPILIATHAEETLSTISLTPHNDNILLPIKTNTETLGEVIDNVLKFTDGEIINSDDWAGEKYMPTPTIIEAAMALYNGHAVSEISRSDASARNLSDTSKALLEIIAESKKRKQKAICFVTGVPGAGKTLVGLNVAAGHFNKKERSSTVFLSGNGPLVAILREALTRDKVKREKQKGNKVKKGEVFSSVKSVIQNVHHFRDECLKDFEAPPFEHVTIFDEAQRAWNLAQTANFMQRKKNHANFPQSEPEFLTSCLDRHKDWAVIICLVGGGQEINTGEAGISEWLNVIYNKFTDWEVCISPNLTDSEYAATESISKLQERGVTKYNKDLHLSVSMRSFRAEKVSFFVKSLLDLNIDEVKETLSSISENYPIILTRDLAKAKEWLKQKSRGTERYGIVVSSQAQRLKPLAIDVKSPMNPVNWFLEGKDDVRSSYYLEDVATEFHVQGLELDWACVTWDGDLRYSESGWGTFSFVGNKWQNIHKEERKRYLINAYRVLLTRARQGMVIVLPEGNVEDHTRKPEYYDKTFNYLKSIGIKTL